MSQKVVLRIQIKQGQLIQMLIRQNLSVEKLIDYFIQKKIIFHYIDKKDLIIFCKTQEINQYYIVNNLNTLISQLKLCDEYGNRLIKIDWKQMIFVQRSYSNLHAQRKFSYYDMFQSQDEFKSACLFIFNNQLSSLKHLRQEFKISHRAYQLFEKILQQHQNTKTKRSQLLTRKFEQNNTKIKKLQKELQSINLLLALIQNKQLLAKKLLESKQNLSQKSYRNIDLLFQRFHKNGNIPSKEFDHQCEQILLISSQNKKQINIKEQLREENEEKKQKYDSKILNARLQQKQEYWERLKKYIYKYNYKDITKVESKYYMPNQHFKEQLKIQVAIKYDKINQTQSQVSRLRNSLQKQNIKQQIYDCTEYCWNFIFVFQLQDQLYGIFSQDNFGKVESSGKGFMFCLTNQKMFKPQGNLSFWQKKATQNSIQIFIGENNIIISLTEKLITIKNQNLWQNFELQTKSTTKQILNMKRNQKKNIKSFQFLTLYFENQKI